MAPTNETTAVRQWCKRAFSQSSIELEPVKRVSVPYFVRTLATFSGSKFNAKKCGSADCHFYSVSNASYS